MDFTKIDYGYLRPPQDVFEISHTDDYIIKGEGNQSVRKIFHGVTFTPFENEKLAEFKQIIQNEGLKTPLEWSDADILRFVYSGRFNLEKSLGNLKSHLEWRSSPKRGTLSEKAANMLVNDFGRDKQYRPLIIINVYKLDLKNMELEEFIEALCFVFDVAKKHYLVPGKVENWLIIVETNSLSLFNFPFKVVKSMIEVLGANFSCTMEKMYITNPSRIFNMAWNGIKAMLDPTTVSKISMLSSSEFNEFLTKISPDQLEERYGGKFAVPVKYWPPINTLNKQPYLINNNQTKSIEKISTIKTGDSSGKLKGSLITPDQKNLRYNRTSIKKVDFNLEMSSKDFSETERTVYYDFDTPIVSIPDIQTEKLDYNDAYLSNEKKSMKFKTEFSPRSTEILKRFQENVFQRQKHHIKLNKVIYDDSLDKSDNSIASEKSAGTHEKILSMKEFRAYKNNGGPKLKPNHCHIRTRSNLLVKTKNY